MSNPIQQTGAELWEFLNVLPLPLLLQSQNGEIVNTNTTWQQQLGHLIATDLLSTEPPQTGSTAIEFCLDHQFSAIGDPSSAKPDPPISATIPTNPTPRTWQLLKLPVTPHGETSASLWLVLAKDITEYRQLSQELAAKNADLIQLNRLKDEFLACITHELKTPLTAMLGLASLLKDAKLGALNARQTHYAQLIHQSGRHLMNVVNDILDLTRLETGQLHLSWGVVDLERVCRRAYAQASQVLHPQSEHEMAEATIPFTLTIETGLATIVADELRLRQMLRHLLENALKFTPTDGEIGLTINRWQGWIDFTIWDTGIGIPESEQHLLFQKFQQLESPLTRQFEGTGLGLVLTQRLARAHGGDVSFISRPGQGSQFTLLLPPQPPTAQAQSEEALAFSNTQSTLAALPNQLVLIVEAAPRYIEWLTDQLRELGYRVIVARSGTEALDKARQLHPQVILLNPVLPMLSGWDVLTLLKADPQTQNIPVLMTATQAEKQQARQYGANGFLSLPITSAALTESFIQLQLLPSGHPQNLTVLYLRPGQLPHPKQSALLQALGTAMGQRQGSLSYRVLEAEDLDQAEVLARVWQPQVLLLDGHQLKTPLPYLQALQQSALLTRLPLITLDAVTTQAAHQLQYAIFPCLVSTGEQQHLDALFQAIQVAAGLKTQPQILLMPLGTPVTSVGLPAQTETEERLAPPPLRSSEFLQALAQYLQTAGMRVGLVEDWRGLRQQLQQSDGDLLLLYVGDSPATLTEVEALESLQQAIALPPILLLRHEQQTPNPAAAQLAARLTGLCDRTIRYSQTQTMDEVLSYIRQTVQ